MKSSILPIARSGRSGENEIIRMEMGMSTHGRKIVLVTGATDGLGRQVARDLAARGATVLLHGRRQEKGRATLRGIAEATGPTRGTDGGSRTDVRLEAARVRQ
jgi:NAD(P)-dependent dehydrogenase (short-subunit alcohol dehydrogenase family)